MKAKSVPDERKGEFGIGDVWTWTALDPDKKRMCSWHVDDRTIESAMPLISDLAGRLAHRVQIATDGHGPYLPAIEAAFGIDVDYAMLIKECASIRARNAGSAPVVLSETVKII